MNDLIERIEAATPESAERDELGIAINEALDIASYITDDGDPTQSIDAALTLVPKGFEWCLEYQAGHHVSSDVECMVAIAKLGDPCRDWESTSATPALALSAAALKARAYLKETNNGQ